MLQAKSGLSDLVSGSNVARLAIHAWVSCPCSGPCMPARWFYTTLQPTKRFPSLKCKPQRGKSSSNFGLQKCCKPRTCVTCLRKSTMTRLPIRIGTGRRTCSLNSHGIPSSELPSSSDDEPSLNSLMPWIVRSTKDHAGKH